MTVTQPTLFDEDPAPPAKAPPARAGPAFGKPVIHEPGGLPQGSVPERLAVAAVLAETLADAAAGKANPDEVYRTLRGSLYVLSPEECVRVANGLILLLREGT